MPIEQSLVAEELPVQQQSGQETTKDDAQTQEPEEQLNDKDQKELIGLVRKLKLGWFLRRRMNMKRVLEAHEFFKGNHFVSFDPESFQWFDALEAAASSGDGKSEDLNMYQFATNFQQMLGFGFVAALSSQVPKSRFLPENAEKEQDIATAKVSSTVQEIVERKNQIKALHKQSLLELWLSGCYFRHTRYVVDKDKVGSHKEPVVQLSQHTAMPDRFLCGQCGGMTDANDLVAEAQPLCGNCGAPLDPNSFFPEETVEMPVAQEFKEVADGMVKMDIYGPLHVDCDPMAMSLADTPILNLEQEVSVGMLRTMFPLMREKIKGSTGSLSSDGEQERRARSLLFSETGSKSQFIQDLQPTYSRTWIQPWAFNEIDEKSTADKLTKMFPEGVMLANIGDLFLDARAAKLTSEWTWCGTIKGKFGLYPPAVGDSAIPVQKRLNDACNITHEYIDRLSGGIVLVNETSVDTRSLNGKPILPGVLNPVQMRKSAGQGLLKDQIVQIKAEMDANIYSYTDKLVYWMQMLTGVTPQVFGGAGDKHVETKGGQEQQLNTAIGKLMLFWDNTREENAAAAEIAVECAADNMIDDWYDVITDDAKEFKNKYVRVDEMQGSIHAYPETDQGFPMSHAEVKAFWEKLVEWASSGKNPYANAMLDEPTNQEQIATWTGVPGLVVPGRSMRNKVLQILDRLIDEQPQQQDSPMGIIMVPSIIPDKEVDDFPVALKTATQYAQENWRLADDKPQGYQNVLAYIRLCSQLAKEKMAENAVPPPPTQGAAQ